MKKYNKISIFAHVDAPGFPEEFIDFVVKNQTARKIVFIKFPFFLSKEKSVICEEYYNRKVIINKKSLLKFRQPELLSYIKDFFYAIYYGYKYCDNSDLFIGTNNLLVLAGLILKKIIKIKIIIYQIVDFSPKRFKNNVINEIFYSVDRLCCYNANYIWPLDKKIIEARIEYRYLNPRKITKWYAVSFGNHSFSLKDRFKIKASPKKLVYLGGLFKYKGAQLFIQIIEKLKNEYPHIALQIIGKGDMDTELQNEINKKNLNNNIKLLGYIEDNNKVNDILLESGIALAPYNPDPISISYFADMGKVKVYLGCGLPVIITRVPPIHKVIEETKSGLIGEYDPDDFAKKISFLIDNPDIYSTYRKNSFDLGLKFDWNILIEKALNEMEG